MLNRARRTVCGLRIALASAVAIAISPVASSQAPTWDDYYFAAAREQDAQHTAQAGARRRFFGDATVLEPQAAPNEWRGPGLDEAARDLTSLGYEALPSTLASRVGARQCRVMILGRGASTFIAEVAFFADGAEVEVWRRGEAARGFGVLGADAADLAKACPDALFSSENVGGTPSRPTWVFEALEGEGHKVLVTSSQVDGPVYDAMVALLEIVRRLAPREATRVRYFPDLAFTPARASDPLDRESDYGPLLEEERLGALSLVEWYRSSFEHLDLPSLYERRVDPDAEIYRLTRLPSFSGPSVVTVELDGGRGELSLLLVGGGEPTCVEAAEAQGRINMSNDVSLECGARTTVRRSLRRGKVRRLRAGLARDEFWIAPSPKDHLMLDGCALLTEGLDHGRYHVTERQTGCVDDAPAPPEVLRIICVRDGEAPGWTDNWPPRCDAL